VAQEGVFYAKQLLLVHTHAFWRSSARNSKKRVRVRVIERERVRECKNIERWEGKRDKKEGRGDSAKVKERERESTKRK
jgi:hypothetical protein